MLSTRSILNSISLAAICASVLCAGAGNAQQPAAQGTPAAPAARPKPCATPEYRQFDFWLGDWEVKGPAGQVAGTNLITRTLDGCVLYESWKGKGGAVGNSFNIYDATDQKWHQTWVDNQGSLLMLTGGLKDGKMVLESGPVPTRRDASKTVLQRITWSKEEGGKVRQLWESSSDGGTTWTVAFDGMYSKKS